MEDYSEWENKVEENIKRNKKFINEFENWLNQKGLSKKTIRKHLNNIDLYVNDYLNYYNVNKMEKGVTNAYSFLNDWFIRKCLYASKTSIEEHASSIRKFYKCMCELGYISNADYEFLNASIKDNMDEFYASLVEINDYEGEEWEEFF